MRIALLVLVLLIAPPAIFLALLFANPTSTSMCGDRLLQVSPANAASFDAKIVRLATNAVLGRAGTATFDESEVSSRASTLLASTNAIDVTDFHICLWSDERQAEATGAVLLPQLPWRLHVAISGAVDLSGQHPRLLVHNVQVGNLPGFLGRLLAAPVTAAADHALEDAVLPYPPTVSITDGAATLSIQPR